MANTIDMKDMRYLNLFQKITRIETRHTFEYNDMIYFCVPKQFLSKALGRDAENIRRISQIIKKRVRIIPLPKGIQHAKDFILIIIAPNTFKEFEIKENEIIITAGSMQNKAALLGRNKKRLSEMQKIIRSYFGKEFLVA